MSILILFPNPILNILCYLTSLSDLDPYSLYPFMGFIPNQLASFLAGVQVQGYKLLDGN